MSFLFVVLFQDNGKIFKDQSLKTDIWQLKKTDMRDSPRVRTRAESNHPDSQDLLSGVSLRRKLQNILERWTVDKFFCEGDDIS